MENYQKAYEFYRTACQNHGIESMNIYQFIMHLTTEQLDEYMKQAV